MSSSAKYDVFISFRGEDTRLNFTSHLHGALCAKGIETFIDNELNKGEDVWPKLKHAIEHSHTSIVIFSENYATSKWCLKELVKILKCRNQKGQVVVPVFCNIDPSDIRKQTGIYKEAFAKHEQDLGDNKVSKWRAALTEASNISGWDSRQKKDEFQFIQDIVNDILQKLYLRYPNEIQGVDGIEKVCERFESLMINVSKLGIWGMGGIGKTTIAKFMFAKHFPKYDSVCFMANVREQSQKLGETHVLAMLLFDLFKGQVTQGSAFTRKKLSDKKVFIVLDDVDSSLQLDNLCAELGDLGEGSKLIITTRNKHLLTGRVDKVYEVEKWDFAKSLKLFSLGAFKKRNPMKGYERFSKRAVKYAGGIPLALKVLGSHFRSRSHDFWECELKKIENKKESFKEIENVLRVSYDGLQESQQAIFLDIAFFFKDENKDYVIRILDACGFFASSGIKILEDKALITISKSNTIQMHDLLQQMGLDIVRDKLSKDFESRLRDIGEVCDVLKNKGTAAVEGITLDLSPVPHLQLSVDTFDMMTKLRFLQLHIPSGKRSETVYQCTVLKALPKKLRYLEWNGFPFKSLPPTFDAEFLIEIRLPYSHVEQLWQGKQALANLEAIDLSECKQLIKLPDLSKASKLKWVYLSGCESLRVIHPSVLSLDTLDTLILDGCKNLKSLKSKKHLSSLQTLSVNGCSSLEEFSVSSELIEKLDLSKTGIKTLHSSIGRFSKLKWLNLEGLKLKNIPDELYCVTCLQNLKISNCRQVIDKQKLHVLCGGLVSLEVLHLKHCYKLCELPDNISTLSSLLELRLDGSSFETLPASIKHLQGLEILSLKNCKKLRFLPKLPPFIKELYAVNCTSLVTVSSLKTFAIQMKGKNKYISFKNGMILDGSSLLLIMEDTEFTVLSAAFHNVLVRWVSAYFHLHSYNYNSVAVCLPGSSVPRPFNKDRTTGSSITIELPGRDSNLVGLIYCVVLSSSRGIKQHGVKIQCQCYKKHRTFGSQSTWYNEAIMELNSNHVVIWYDPYHYDSIFRMYDQNVRFEFYATSECEENDGLISIKECGVHLLCYSESMFHNFLKELDLELNLKLDLGLKLGLALDIELDLKLDLGLKPGSVLDIEKARAERSIKTKLLSALDNEDKLDELSKLELESRRQALSMAIEPKNNDCIVEPQHREAPPTSIEPTNNGIRTPIHDQEEDPSKKCSCSCNCIVDILMFFWGLIGN